MLRLLEVLDECGPLTGTHRRHLQIDILHFVGRIRAIDGALRRMMAIAQVTLRVVVGKFGHKLGAVRQAHGRDIPIVIVPFFVKVLDPDQWPL
jgi:hypothetical protein